MSFSDLMDFEWDRPRVFDERFAPDEYDPLQRSPRRGYTAGRGCLTHGHPEPVRRRRGHDVQAPVRAGVDRPRSPQNPFAPREPVQRDNTVGNAGEGRVEVILEVEKAARRMKPAVVGRVTELVNSPIDCPICFEEVANPFILGCGHVVCEGCLKELLSRNDKKCPHCRGKLDTAKVTDRETFLEVHASSSS